MTDETKKPDFGDYVSIEQKRYGAQNKMYLFKVIGVTKSNSWVDVPVEGYAAEVIHTNIEAVARCVMCGVSETEIRKYRIEDLQEQTRSLWGDIEDLLEPIEGLEEALHDVDFKQNPIIEAARKYLELTKERTT